MATAIAWTGLTYDSKEAFERYEDGVTIFLYGTAKGDPKIKRGSSFYFVFRVKQWPGVDVK
jgi:hypothetical protein